MRVPGIGPITAFAIQAFAGDLKGFRNGREFAGWLGLTPKEHSTGGKQRFDASNMSPWLMRMLDEKP